MTDPHLSLEDNLRAEYGEVSSNIRWLADVRFKLLGLVPLATILGGWFFTSDTSVINPLISLFGLVITLALMIYNERNDQHYGELIDRAKELERALGLHGGQLRQRSGTWLTVLGVRVNHTTAVNLIYQASVTVWVFGILYPILDYGLRTIMVGSRLLRNQDAVSIALISAILSVLGVWSFFRALGWRKSAREKAMRTAAREAMGIIVGLPLQHTLDDEEWQKAFELLATVNMDLSTKEKRDEKEAQARYYIQEHANLAQPPFPKPSIARWDVESAAYLAALLTDLPARWYETMYRQREIEAAIQPVESDKPQDMPPAA